MPSKKKARPETVPHSLGSLVQDAEWVAVALDPGVRYILQAIKAGRLEAKKTGRQDLVTQEAVCASGPKPRETTSKRGSRPSAT